MKSPPILSTTTADTHDDDAMEQARANQSRLEGQAIVREHLSNHLEHNTGRSSDYVTWIATLHPENADVTIDSRFLIPGNPWWAIYEEAKSGIPTATAVPVVVNQDDVERPSTNQSSTSQHIASTITNTSNQQNQNVPQVAWRPHCLCLCSPLDVLVGSSLTLCAICAVFSCEVVAYCIYVMGALFYWMAKPMEPPNCCTGVFYSFLMILYYSFALSDSILLLSSVLITECLAVTAWIVSLLLGGVMAANTWHQYIRRLCHLIRWGFRAPFNEPPRHCFCLGDKCTDNDRPSQGSVSHGRGDGSDAILPLDKQDARSSEQIDVFVIDDYYQDNAENAEKDIKQRGGGETRNGRPSAPLDPLQRQQVVHHADVIIDYEMKN